MDDKAGRGMVLGMVSDSEKELLGRSLHAEDRERECLCIDRN